MRIGMVCPYSLDVPGGVQFHVRDLAEHFLGVGHEVSVLAPADDDTPLPPYVVSAGRAVPVRYNGSVARLNFGPVTSARVNRWVEDGDFDVLHLHEPVTPSVAVLALWVAQAPVVATFHTSTLRSRAMQAAYPLLRPSLEKILARIAVSEDARRTVITHVGGDAVVIPNGVNTGQFQRAYPRSEWLGTPAAPTYAFLGRIDEPRKGLPVVAAAMERVLARLPHARLLVAGPGDIEGAAQRLPDRVRERTRFLGLVSEADKAALLASVTAYVAPHTGGESFGIVLVEAMAAGAPVIASKLNAFEQVIGNCAAALTFEVEDDSALAEKMIEVATDPRLRAAMASAGPIRAADFDWHRVAADIMGVYETVTDTARLVADAGGETRWSRLFRPRKGTP